MKENVLAFLVFALLFIEFFLGVAICMVQPQYQMMIVWMGFSSGVFTVSVGTIVIWRGPRYH